jgi:hypothetical protein
MSYYAKVKVLVLNEDVTTKKMLTMHREDMSFKLLVNDPSEIVRKAKDLFNSKHAPDLHIRSCNVAGRDACILYCMPKEMRKTTLPMAAHGSGVNNLPKRGR